MALRLRIFENLFLAVDIIELYSVPVVEYEMKRKHRSLRAQ